MGIDFDKVHILEQRLYYELSSAAQFCLSQQFRGCEAAMDRAQNIREMIHSEVTMEKMAGTG